MVRSMALSLLLVLLVPPPGSAAAQSLRRMVVGEGAWLGVSVSDVTKKIARENKQTPESGALVSAVMEGSPAEEAGIRTGDVIVRFDDREVGDSDDLVRAVRRSDAGDKVNIVVRRNGESKSLTATLEKPDGGRIFTYREPSFPRSPRAAPVPAVPFRMDFPGRSEVAGLGLQSLGRQLGEYFEVPGRRGVLVTSVRENSAGEKAGIRAGDVIVRVNGNTVRDLEDCIDEIRDADSDDVGMDLIRRGKQIGVSVRIDEHSDLMSGGGFFHDGRVRWRDQLRMLKENLPADREKIEELKESLREMKEELRDGIRENFHESFLDDLRELRDVLRETIGVHVPLLRRVARATFLSI